MARRDYTFREFLRDRGEEELLSGAPNRAPATPEPEIGRLVLREVKLAAAAFSALVLAVTIVFYQPEVRRTRNMCNVIRSTPDNNAQPTSVPSRDEMPDTPAPPVTACAPAAVAAVPPANPSTPPPPAETVYIVRAGDTLEGIARRYYGSGRHWRLVARRNSISEPTSLRIGTRLVLPQIQPLGE